MNDNGFKNAKFYMEMENQKISLDEIVGWPIEMLNNETGYYAVRKVSGSLNNFLVLIYENRTDSFRLFKSVLKNKNDEQRCDEVIKHISKGYFVNYYGTHMKEHANPGNIIQLWYEFEYTSCGNLELYLNYKKSKNERISTLQKLIIILNSLYALAILHNVPNILLIHRNISPEEIYLAYDNTDHLYLPLISGFDKSRVLPSNCNTDLTNLSLSKYSAPETSESDNYNAKADIYSLGVVLYQVIAEEELFGDITEDRLIYERGKITKDKLSQVPSLYYDLLECMLRIDPDQRLGALEMIKRFHYYVVNNYDTYPKDGKLTPNIKLVFNKYYQKGGLELENIDEYHSLASNPRVSRNLHGKFDEVKNVYMNDIAPWTCPEKIMLEIENQNCRKPI